MYILKEIKEIILPNFKQKKTRDEKVGAFSVIIDNFDAAVEILSKANKLGLTSQNLVVRPTKKASTLAFFYKGDYDIEYIETAEESVIRNLVPRLSARNDKYSILRMIRLAAEQKKELRKLLGVKSKTLRQLLNLKKQYKNTLIDLHKKCSPVKTNTGCICKPVYVDVCSHYVQIDTQFFAKNPNDKILIKTR